MSELGKHSRMKIPYFLIYSLLVGVLFGDETNASEFAERKDWGVFFEAENVEGTIVVHQAQSGKKFTYNPARANRRYVPASTFKIPHTFFALDAGIVKDEHQVIPWNGVEHGIAGWN